MEYPSISFTAVCVNLAAWFWFGMPLFSFWHFAWIVPVEILCELAKAKLIKELVM